MRYKITKINSVGFSLIEVMIVLIITLILLGLTVPIVNEIKDHAQEEIVQAKLLHAIIVARHEAQMQHIPIAMCKTDDFKHCGGEWIKGWLVFKNPNADGVVVSAEQILSTSQISSAQAVIHWRSFPYFRDFLIFMPNEIPTSDNGTFWLCKAHEKNPRWAIVINRFAKAHTILPNKNGTIFDSGGNLLLCE